MGTAFQVATHWMKSDFRIKDPGDAGTIRPERKGYCHVELISAGAETRTLADPTKENQRMLLSFHTDGGDITLTASTAYDQSGNTVVTFNDTGDYIEFVSVYDNDVDKYVWRTVAYDGVSGPETEMADLSLNGSLTFDSAADVVVQPNTDSALEVSDGTTKVVDVDTRNTVKDTSSVTITGQPATIATEGAAHSNPSLNIAAKTITYTGTTTTTSHLGAQLSIAAPTFTDASSATLSLASSVHIAAVAAAGGMLTLTAARMISTSVSDCYLTNAGVWTDTACWAYGKEAIADAAGSAIDAVMEKIVPKTWTYKADVHGDDFNRQRVGVVYDDLPEELRCPGEEKGVSPGILASYALAAARRLWDQNKALTARLDRLEAQGAA